MYVFAKFDDIKKPKYSMHIKMSKKVVAQQPKQN